ncbi:MAG: TVP38/TMEM64 family protein [Desulfobacteraceae bacterium]|jgi:uncharacterized membrane protein YdjX (TVP38/TMEM64 family)
MGVKKLVSRLWLWMLCGLCICIFTAFWFREPLEPVITQLYELLTDRESVTAYVESFGNAAPVVFMAIQIFQVILAPIPGEATGFIGGYLFGALAGCFYSTVALTIGSWVNFCIGRLLGKHWVRRVVPQTKIKKYDHLVRHQGILVVFVLFLFPGFPKDYLCLILGLSTIPMRVFLLMALVGRIPGTLMLSLQGALVFEKNYFIFVVIVLINLVMVYIGYRCREGIYRWVEKINGPRPGNN